MRKKTNGKLSDTNGKSKIGIYILNDQLSPHFSLFEDLDRSQVQVCLVESLPTFSEIRFHKKRLALVLSMVRHFAAELNEIGYAVTHYQLGDPLSDDLCRQGELACLKDFVQRHSITALRVMEACEYDENQFLKSLEKKLGIPVEIKPNNQFLVSRTQFSNWYNSESDPGMETFYRFRRRETGLLMQEDQPLGGRWNYDMDNRVPPTGNMPVPDLPVFEPDVITQEVIDLVNNLFPENIGDLSDFSLPVTRQQVDAWFQDFLDHRLRLFGMYQDAMLSKSNRMYHAIISPYLNHGLLDVRTILNQVEKAYIEEKVPINSAEGFIRQVLGWREYIHGVYWLKMPDYREENYLGFERQVPDLMRTADTHFKCIKCVLEQAFQDGYAHHIQRLMILGNFSLLVGIHPKKLVNWFRELFIDSSEWAALPNVMGMILYADGGFLGSKPYAASAHYINKMSDYCHGCYYKGRKRVGEKACPLNFLYWNFVGEHQEFFRRNSRMQTAIQMYRLKPEAERKLIQTSSKEFLDRLDEFGTDRKLRKKLALA